MFIDVKSVIHFTVKIVIKIKCKWIVVGFVMVYYSEL